MSGMFHSLCISWNSTATVESVISCYALIRLFFFLVFMAKILLWLNTGFILSNLLLVNFIGQSKCETKHHNTHLRKIFHYFFTVHNATGTEYTPSGKRHVLRIKFSTWHSTYPTNARLAQPGIVHYELIDSTCISISACVHFLFFVALWVVGCGSNDDSTKRWVKSDGFWRTEGIVNLSHSENLRLVQKIKADFLVHNVSIWNLNDKSNFFHFTPFDYRSTSMSLSSTFQKDGAVLPLAPVSK